MAYMVQLHLPTTDDLLDLLYDISLQSHLIVCIYISVHPFGPIPRLTVTANFRTALDSHLIM